MLDRVSVDSRTAEFADRSGASGTTGEVIQFEAPISDAEVKLLSVLDAVRAGEVESVGIAIAYKDGAINTCWSTTKRAGLLMGAVALLQQRLCRD